MPAVNKLAERFVRNLRSSIGKWKMTDESFDLYVEKLSRWRLTSDQWSRATSKLINSNPEGELPTLPALYALLKSVQESEDPSSRSAIFFNFRAIGRDHSARVWDDNGTWRLMKVQRDDDGLKWKMVKTDKPFTAPADATDVRFTPPPEQKERSYEPVRDNELQRNLFYKGWCDSGADPGKCEAMFNSIQIGPVPS
jgi:hypothetical protein